jgi:thiamine biosynthesis lipoprotein
VEPGRILDLGAIGKGFALECMSRILSDHGIVNALLASGASTILAMGELEWPVDLAHSRGTRRLQLRGGALAASGTSEQGDHIVNPVDGSAPKNFRNVWVLHPSATMADAFSTACFVMNEGQIREFLANAPCECQVITDPDWE